jgi:hypothetical protein
MKQLTKEQEEKGIELMRKEMGISGDATMGTSDGRIERVRIAEAKFFPKLPTYWKQTKVSIYNVISKDADEYIR